MVDREKVLEHITDCVRIADCQINHNWVFVRTEILKDALALLKAQEPCEDAVSRKAVINITAETGALETQARIKQLPSVQSAYVPRVMTLEEVVGNIVLERDVILWFEFHDSIKELNAKDIEYNDYLCDNDMPTLYEPNLKWRDNGYLDGVIIFEYNNVFRCWTSRPSDERRKAVAWE